MYANDPDGQKLNGLPGVEEMLLLYPFYIHFRYQYACKYYRLVSVVVIELMPTISIVKIIMEQQLVIADFRDCLHDFGCYERKLEQKDCVEGERVRSREKLGLVCGDSMTLQTGKDRREVMMMFCIIM